NNNSGAIEPGASDPLPEVVTYARSSGQIVRTVNGSTQTLISNVPDGGLRFQYYKRDGTPIALGAPPAALTAAQRDSVAFVRVHIGVQVDGTRTTPAIVEMSARAALRNRILDRL
ncbi:MAG: hypothetical protein ACREQY_24345, partial [Candidatus Binatia bacterium]